MYNNRQKVIEAFKAGIFPYIDGFQIEKEPKKESEQELEEESEEESEKESKEKEIKNKFKEFIKYIEE